MGVQNVKIGKCENVKINTAFAWRSFHISHFRPINPYTSLLACTFVCKCRRFLKTALMAKWSKINAASLVGQWEARPLSNDPDVWEMSTCYSRTMQSSLVS